MFEEIFSTALSALLYAGSAFVLSMALTRLCIYLLPRWGFVDAPGGRHIHKEPTPRGGGIAIILSFFLVASLYTFFYSSLPNADIMQKFILPAAAITAGGILDDRFSLSSKVKLLFQIAAGLLFWSVGVRLNCVLTVQLPDIIALPLTVLWTVTIVNAFNLIDGMDGVAAGLGCVAAISLSLWGGLLINSTVMVVVPLIFAASCAGFLRYNFSPARIFMGDTGSMFLGLFFAYAGLNAFGKSATLASLLVPVLAVGVPLFDVSLAFWRRLVRKFLNPESASGIMSADVQHLHHRLLQELSCSKKAALRIYLLACAMVGMGFLAFYFERTIPVLGYAAVIFLLLYIFRRVARVELYDSALLLKRRMARSHKLLIVLAALPFLDLISLMLGGIIAGRLLSCQLNYFSMSFLPDFALLSAPVLVFLFITGCYRIFWARAGYEDLRKLIEASVCGLVSSCLIFYAFRTEDTCPALPAFLAIFSLVSFLGICLCRVAIAYFGMRMLWGAPLSSECGERHPNLLLYGGGLNTALFITFNFNRPQPKLFHVLGIIDDDKTLDGLTVFGHRVLGSSEDLPEILKKYKIDKLVVTISTIPDEKLRELQEVTREYGVELSRFQPQEVKLE